MSIVTRSGDANFQNVLGNPRPQKPQVAKVPGYSGRDRFEKTSGEMSWLVPALAHAANRGDPSADYTKSPTLWTCLKGLGKVIGGVFSVIGVIAALGVLALLQSKETAEPSHTATKKTQK